MGADLRHAPDDFLSARRRRRVVAAVVVVTVLGAVAWWVWLRRPAGYEHALRLPRDVSVVMVLDIEALADEPDISRHLQDPGRSELLGLVGGEAVESVALVLVAGRWVGDDPQQVAMIEGNFDLDALQRWLERLGPGVEYGGRIVHEIAGGSAGLLDDTILVLGHAALVVDIFEERSSLADNDRMIGLLRNVSPGAPGWGVGVQERERASATFYEAAFIAELEWGAPPVLHYEWRFDTPRKVLAASQAPAAELTGGVDAVGVLSPGEPGKVTWDGERLFVTISWDPHPFE